MTEDLLKNIINNFSTEDFIHFFRLKNSHFKPDNEPVHHYNDDNFNDCLFIGEIPFDSAQRLHIYSFRVTDSLTERSGKKKQYEKGKRILKETNTDAGIFIFYDNDGNFRFSLIYTEYSAVRRSFSYFKRFTYFVSPRLTNKTFLKQIGEGDFSSLEKIKEAFSVEPVTKQFYEEIQNWYFWAMDKVKFPEDYKYSNDNDRDKEIRTATNLIRLITRTIFIWFIKEKGLIPEDLFDRENLKGIVKNFNKPSASNYYNAILQNLFFATLNSRMEERGWAKDEGYPKNKTTHGVKNLYRYEDKFLIGEKEVLNLFKEIPFLNGGLFDCLDKEDESGKVIYIDGFSRNSNKQALIPDYLFFQQDETRVDLSAYGLGSNKQVRGLIEILKSYNFTIDESTPVDQEVALDPELLGKVFENLLASYNPETATTARKSTGSYYTPREIVDFMVDESLKEYFKIQLPGIDEEKIELLVSYAEESSGFSQEEKQKIISAIDRAKILDPACGSGAFPMGILHKLVHILQKIDPNNDFWYELQYQKALRASEEVFKEKDKSERGAMLKEINKAFDESINYPDYARKLYLIENCIYGIDIQPIAIQISKLRFFISLVLDQKVDRTKENLGIRALPNLETKFVAANTLIGLDMPRIDLFSENDQMNKLQEKLKNLRHEYFTAKTREQKMSLQSRDREIRTQMSNLLEKKLLDEIQREIEQLKNRVKHEEDILLEIKQGPEEKEIREIGSLFFGLENKIIIIDKKKEKIESQKRIIKELKKNLGKLINIEKQQIKKQARKIASFDLFDQNASADWFDPEWMFGVVDGFDIVIGNPPHGADISKYKDYVESNFKFFETRKNSASLFIEKSFELLKQEGVLAYVIPKSITFVESWKKTRDLIYKNNRLLVLIDITKAFENVKLEQIILICQKTKNGSYFYKTGDFWDGYIRINTEIKTEIADKLEILPLYTDGIRIGILNKLLENSVKLYSISKTFRGLPYQNKISEDGYPILRGKNINKYLIYRELYKVQLTKSELNSPKVKQLMKPKIISQNIVAHVMNPFDRIIIMATYDRKGFLTLDTVMNTFLTNNSFSYEYILGILNSRLAEWFYYWFVYNRAIRTMHFDESYIGKLPIKKITFQNQPIANQIITLVDQILLAKKQNPEADTSHLEQEIDHLVYKLYDLTDEEIKLIEGNKL